MVNMQIVREALEMIEVVMCVVLVIVMVMLMVTVGVPFGDGVYSNEYIGSGGHDNFQGGTRDNGGCNGNGVVGGNGSGDFC